MPTYVGFSTINANQPRQFLRPGVDGGVGTITQQPRVGKKFRLVDAELVARDLENAFSIRQGEKVGNPTYGTTIWDYAFEPNNTETANQLEQEIRRVAGLDPRLTVNTVDIFQLDNGILVELQITVSPFNNEVQLGLLFDRQSSTVQAVTG